MTRTPDLTRRDLGEMLTANPPLRNIELARVIKSLWADGMKQGKIARATCQKVDYVKKFTACFYRAANASPTELGEGQNHEKLVQWPEKRWAKQKPQKKHKTLTVNLTASIAKKTQREYAKSLKGEGHIVPKNCKLIPLRGGHFAIVSNVDFSELLKFKWLLVVCKHTNYARRFDSETKKYVSMHRQILGLTDPKILTDHKNGNGLDNRRENLRPCNAEENARNQRISKRNTSGFKGVSWKDADLRWQAKIRFKNKSIHLGHFKSVIEAARAYNEAAKKYHGEFARLNEI